MWKSQPLLIGSRVVLHPGVRRTRTGLFGLHPTRKRQIKFLARARVVIGARVDIGGNTTIDGARK